MTNWIFEESCKQTFSYKQGNTIKKISGDTYRDSFTLYMTNEEMKEYENDPEYDVLSKEIDDGT